MPEPTEPPVPLRLVTWNLNHWRQPLLPVDTRRAAWTHLADTIGAQVSLLQEAVPPLDLPQERAVYGELAGHRNWGSAVVALDPAVTIEPLRSVRGPWSRRRFLLANTHPGSMAVARLTIAGIEPITLVSVYGVMDGSSVSTMLRIAADLVPLFDSPHGARVILGGDFNVSRAGKDPRYLARSEAVLGPSARSGWSRRRRSSRSRRHRRPSAGAGPRGPVTTFRPGAAPSSTTCSSPPRLRRR